MTPAQKRKRLARAEQRLTRAAKLAREAHDDVLAATPEYGRAGMLRMSSARATDDMTKNLRAFRDEHLRYVVPN